MLLEQVTALIGEVPSGAEPLLWLVCALILVFFLDLVFAVVWSVVKWIGGK